MTILKAIIIDDESAARSLLSQLIKEYIDHVDIVGTAASALEGVKLLTQVSADIIFLDIEMPGGNGFDFLEAIDQSNYKIIFTTAHKEFAIKAFKFKADGYLLKPIDLDDLENSISQFIKEKEDNTIPLAAENRITFRTQESIEYIPAENIIRVESDGNYATIYRVSGQKLTITKNMKQVEAILHHDFFIKPHKSYLINRNHITRFAKQDGGYFVMVDGSSVPVSRRKKDEILKLLEE